MNGDAGGSGKTGQTTISDDQRKLESSEVNFQRHKGIPGFRCGDCFFYENGQCRIVTIMTVSPDDLCDEFEPDRRGKLTSGNITAPGVIKPESGEKKKSMATAKSMSVIGPLRRVVPTIVVAEMYITRVAEDKQTGVRRWSASASGIERDLYDERMSVELFNDFIKRAESREAVPIPFASEAWSGGLPYLGVAHYLDMNGHGIAGDTKQIFTDGDYFKARGDFRNSPLGLASYTSIKKDIDTELPHDFRVRISIAFIDWLHEHEGYGMFTRNSMIDRCDMCERGLGEKVYKAGHLVHLALTRRPAYPKASISLED